MHLMFTIFQGNVLFSLAQLPAKLLTNRIPCYATPMESLHPTQLLDNEVILPLLLSQLSAAMAVKSTQLNKGKQRCEFTAQMTFYSHSWTDKKAGERKCLIGTRQAGPLSHSCSSAVLGEGKDTGVPLMFYKVPAGNSRCPGQVLPASLCTWDPAT